MALFGCNGSSGPANESTHVANPKDGLWQDAPEHPFSFVLEQTWGAEDGPDEQLLPSFSSFIADKDGNIYFYDRSASQIVSYDEEGNHRWSKGRKGEGPGEINSIYGMVYDPIGYLYLFNQRGRRIDRFTLVGEYVDNVLTETMGLSTLFAVDMLDEHTLVATGVARGILGAKVVIIDTADEWSLVTSFVIDQTDDLQLSDGVSASPDVVVFNNEIVNSHITKYLVQFRDTTGSVTSSFSRDINKLIAPGFYQSGSTSSIGTFSNLGTPLRLGDDLSLMVSNWPVTAFDPNQRLKDNLDQSTPRVEYDTETVLDFYNGKHELLYSWTAVNREGLPTDGILGVDKQGRVYARTKEPFPQIGRYRVEVKRP